MDQIYDTEDPNIAARYSKTYKSYLQNTKEIKHVNKSSWIILRVIKGTKHEMIQDEPQLKTQIMLNYLTISSYRNTTN